MEAQLCVGEERWSVMRRKKRGANNGVLPLERAASLSLAIFPFSSANLRFHSSFDYFSFLFMTRWPTCTHLWLVRPSFSTHTPPSLLLLGSTLRRRGGPNVLEQPLPYQPFHVRAAQEVVRALLQIDGALVGHDFAAVRQDAHLDAHFLGRLKRGEVGGGEGREERERG